MGLWSDNVNTNIRARFGDLIVNNPTENQREEIIDIINKNTTLNEEGYTTDLNMITIRYLIKNLTNINYEEEISSKTDEQLNEDIKNSNMNLKQLLNSIREIIDEIVYDVHIANLSKIDDLGQYIELMRGNSKMESIANKLNISVDTLIGISNQDPKALEELQKAMSNKNKAKSKKKNA